MTRKDYDTLLNELSETRQYINILIHDNTYGIINPHAWPHEVARVKELTKFVAMTYLPKHHNTNAVKRAPI